MTPLRLQVRHRADGSRRFLLACSCWRTEAIVMGWESEPAVVADLREQHRKAAPLCRHRTAA